MEIKDFVFFIPTRKSSERVISKNTRPFSDVKGGLLHLKIRQLLEMELNIPIVLSTNDEESKRVASEFRSEHIKIIDRPEHLCLSETNINDFINYIPSIIESDKHVFWVHTTAPFVEKETYLDALNTYMHRTSDFDSLMSVTPIRQFIWDSEINKCINHDRTSIKWPRTQDLKVLYEINHAFYINSISNYNEHNDRIGIKPYMYKLKKLESFDVDWEEDFNLAEQIYSLIYKKHSE
jgi:N-acylneuraminate cytidylyltransferase